MCLGRAISVKIEDFEEDPNAEPEELWEPQGATYVNDELVIERTYYNGEEIIQPPQRWISNDYG